MAKDSFILFTEYGDQLSMFTDEQVGKLFRAIFQYQKTGDVQIELDTMSNVAFGFIKNNLDRANKKYDKKVECGKKGGAPVGNSNATKQPKTTKNNLKVESKQPNEYEYEYVYENENVNEDGNKECAVNVSQVVPSSIFNLFCETCSKLVLPKELSDKHSKAIQSLIDGGMTIKDFTDYFKMVNSTEFLTGKNDRGWTASLTWLLDKNNMQKINNGEYKSFTPKAAKGSSFTNIDSHNYTDEEIVGMYDNFGAFAESEDTKNEQ